MKPPATTHPPTTPQHAPKEDEDTRTRSPEWLKPVVMMPSIDCTANARQLDPPMHLLVEAVIVSNYRAACFRFYTINVLERTKYGRFDKDGLYMLGNLGIQSAGALTLQTWLIRLQRAASHLKSQTGGSIYDFSNLSDLFSRMLMIEPLTDHQGKLDVENLEQNLLTGVELCKELQHSEAISQLQVLWMKLHTPSWVYRMGPSRLAIELRMLKAL